MAGKDRLDSPGHGRRDRVTGSQPPIPREVQDAVERSAVLRRGLALLHRAPAEVVAAAIGVDARTVEEARERLERPGERGQLIQVFTRALARRGEERPGDPPPPPPRRDPDELIREAERHAHGLDFLRRAPPETVAITFAVHPELVHRARAVLAALGLAPAETGEDA
jgi:hypothetical protein